MSTLQVEQLMQPHEIENIGIEKLTKHQQQQLLEWGMRMFSLGRQHIGDIEQIKYGGRLVILEDGSRWEVDEFDAGTVEVWGEFTKVVIIDDEMYRLEETEKVSVQED